MSIFIQILKNRGLSVPDESLALRGQNKSPPGVSGGLYLKLLFQYVLMPTKASSFWNAPLYGFSTGSSNWMNTR